MTSRSNREPPNLLPAKWSIASPTSDSDIVVISILPPITPRDSRLLWKRLRTRYPDLPIVVGFWTASNAKELLAEPEEDSASKVATKLSEAVAAVRSIAAQ